MDAPLGRFLVILAMCATAAAPLLVGPLRFLWIFCSFCRDDDGTATTKMAHANRPKEKVYHLNHHYLAPMVVA